MARIAFIACLGALAAGCGSSSFSSELGDGERDPSGFFVEPIPSSGSGSTAPVIEPGTARPQVVVRPFRVADLPLVELPALPESPPKQPLGFAPTDVEIERQPGTNELRVRRTARTVTRVEIDGIPSVSANGLRIACGTLGVVKPITWEKLTWQPSGDTATYTYAVGWFDAERCSVHEVGRKTIQPTSIVGGVVYGLRTCNGPCKGDEKLVVLTPPLIAAHLDVMGRDTPQAASPFGRLSFDLVRGSALSFSARIDQTATTGVFGHAPPTWAIGIGQMLIGVDITQSVSDAEPVAVAHIGREVKPPPEPQPEPTFGH